MDYFLQSTTGKIFTGLGSEYRLVNKCLDLNVPPLLTKINSPNRLFDFTNDRTFLAYVNNSILKSNYDKPNPSCSVGENVWHVRDLIYQDCYSDIDIIEKDLPGDNLIAEHINKNYVPEIEKKFPIIFCLKKFIFNLKKYYDEKEKQ
jgi:hypothetical protein